MNKRTGPDVEKQDLLDDQELTKAGVLQFPAFNKRLAVDQSKFEMNPGMSGLDFAEGNKGNEGQLGSSLSLLASVTSRRVDSAAGMFGVDRSTEISNQPVHRTGARRCDFDATGSSDAGQAAGVRLPAPVGDLDR